MSFLDTATLVALVLVMPGMAVVQARALRGVRIPRLSAYASSAVTLVVLGAWCTGWGVHRWGPEVVGFVALPLPELVGWALLVTAAGLAVMWGFGALGGVLGMEESAILRELLPRTGRERLAFAGLSLMAGLGEEIVYRGFALNVLGGLVGVVVAGVVTSVAFGILHAYQGRLGVVRTAVLGGVLAWAFVACGSVWPLVIAHATLDLLGGLVLAEKLMSPAKPESVP